MAEKRDSLRPCKDFEPDLVLYHYGDCPAAEKYTIESHLPQCEPCRRFLQELRSLLPSTVQIDEPPPGFWQDYSRELRFKLAAESEKGSWRRIVASFFHPWPVPAIAMAAILTIGVAITFTNGKRSTDVPTSPEFVEMASNADFFTSLDLLDSMDILESVEAQEAQKGETAQHL